jgi:adenylate kinase
MIILFIGPQGSGKGTQAKIISKKLGFCHISTGDLFRETTGELKELADSYIEKGNLVPSKIVIAMLKERIKEQDCEKGIILDGFPRTIEQDNYLNEIMKIDKIFEISISDKESIKRLNGRWNCKRCGIMYNIFTSPKPKQDKICDQCGEDLYQRGDDADKAAIKKRLEVYHNETKPILEKHKDSVIKINGEQSIEKITEEIIKKLN